MKNYELDYETLYRLPKVELHLHLDCSLSYEVVHRIKPEIAKENFEKEFIAPPKCKNLADFLKRIQSGIALMQTKEGLEIVVEDLFKQLKNENVILAEIRFAPLLHCKKDLTPENVVEIVGEKTKQCIKQTGIAAGLILCTLRHFNESQSLKTVRLVEKFIPSLPVVGFDLAADEAGYTIDAHHNAFQYAIECGVPRTTHAGEAKGADSMWESIEYFRPSRIGHGVRCIEDQNLVEELKKRNIHLEICPSCNIQTDVFNSFNDHPINYLYDNGISLSVNTDARTLVNVTLTNEYNKLVNTFNWSLVELKQCNLNAIEHSFLDKVTKRKIIARICAEY